jgi:hypothetical protein
VVSNRNIQIKRRDLPITYAEVEMGEIKTIEKFEIDIENFNILIESPNYSCRPF